MSKRSRGVFKAILYFVGFLFLIFIVWIAVNIFYKTPIPKPLWTLKDLPPPPPADQNGWAVFYKEFKKDPSAYKLESIAGDDIFQAIMMVDFDETMDVGKTCVSLSKDNIENALALDGSKEYQTFYETLGYPDFMNTNYTLGYPQVLDYPMASMEILNLFKLSLLRAVKYSCDGDYKKSFDILNTLLRGSINFSKTPILLPLMVGSTTTGMVIDVINALMKYNPDEARKAMVGTSSLMLFKSAVKDARFYALSIDNSIKCEYVIQSSTISYIGELLREGLEGDKAEKTKIRLWQFLYDNSSFWINFPIFFDEGSTLEQINIVFKKYGEAIEDPGILEEKGEGYFKTPHYNYFSIIKYNAIGKILLNLFDPNLAYNIVIFDEKKREIQSTASEILKTLNSYETPSEGTWKAH